jgi:hypothetical protein
MVLQRSGSFMTFLGFTELLENVRCDEESISLVSERINPKENKLVREMQIMIQVQN